MYRTLVALGGAVMALSALAPWIAGPFGQTLIPWDVLRLLREQFGWDLPREALLFFGMFAAAALVAVLALVGAAPRVLALLVGLYPVGLGVYAWLEARDQLAQFGVPLPESGEAVDWGTVWSETSPLIGNGLWLFLGGMIALILAGLAGGRR